MGVSGDSAQGVLLRAETDPPAPPRVPSAHERRPRRRYLVATARARDDFQLPLALAEVDALAGMVTDFYLPDALARGLGHGRSVVRKWHHPRIPSARISRSWRAAWIELRKKFVRENDAVTFRAVDRALSTRFAAVARRAPAAGLLAYSNYAHQAFAQVANTPKVIFQFHPHPDYARAIFEADYARFPEVRWSFENATDSQPRAALDEARLEEWRLADAFLCASGVTARSLRHAGCTAPVHVVPYGIKPGYTGNARPELKSREVCTFLFVGQGLQRKGLHHLMRAWRRAGLERARLVVVTSRLDPGIAPLLEQPGVTVQSRLSNTELRDAFATANVFVMPSLIEGFGLVFLEALAAGCFCIGTENTGLPDLDLPSASVDYVEPGMIEALADTLVAAERRWLSGELDPAAIARQAEKFTMERFRVGVRDALARIEDGLGAAS